MKIRTGTRVEKAETTNKGVRITAPDYALRNRKLAA